MPDLWRPLFIQLCFWSLLSSSPFAVVVPSVLCYLPLPRCLTWSSEANSHSFLKSKRRLLLVILFSKSCLFSSPVLGTTLLWALFAVEYCAYPIIELSHDIKLTCLPPSPSCRLACNLRNRGVLLLLTPMPGMMSDTWSIFLNKNT